MIVYDDHYITSFEKFDQLPAQIAELLQVSVSRCLPQQFVNPLLASSTSCMIGHNLVLGLGLVDK